MKAAIISGGILDNNFILSYLDESFDCMIAADKGLLFFYETGKKPDLIMGDFDSIPSKILSHYRETMPDRILTYPSVKDETDTELAILKALEMGAKKIHLLGATGGRVDHLLGTMKNLGLGLDKGAEIYLVDKANRIRMIAEGKTVLHKNDMFGTYFSIIPYENSLKGLTIRGSMYDVQQITLEGFISRGVSNQMLEDVVEIEIEEGKAYLMETCD
ncbi:thiamine diphosphokinase [Eubacterium oxidoreducens]|uniref:Thiamine diphosphokinase n=1 Tax=Eubacterium oxidoreducens TaxID=1732 RepID=A0A1G6B6W5_EUBOX|nr:thiamine diphosphokinase [Eubacterium oxidoreducens]SDB16153.1 thiamine pyrophosphokinase [Eubacterium oxidoreducens]